jgi:hypothetical protein
MGFRRCAHKSTWIDRGWRRSVIPQRWQARIEVREVPISDITWAV